MLNVHGRIDVDARMQKLLDVLIAFVVARPRRIRMGELVDKDEPRGAFDSRI